MAKTPKKTSTKKAPAQTVTPKKADKFMNGSDPSGMWNRISGGFAGFGSSDIYGEQAQPGVYDLLAANQDCVFACVNLIGNKLGSVSNRVKLCVTTGPTDPQPKSFTKAVSHRERERLFAEFKHHTRKATDVREVVDHGLLDLLERPNPKQSFSTLIRLTAVLLGLAGDAYWYKAHPKMFPEAVTELWLLPTQNVEIQKDDTGTVTAYLLYPPGDGEAERLDPEDVIHFRYFNPLDAHGYGYSPLKSVWQTFQLLRQEQSSWQAVLTNMAFPSAILSSKDDKAPLTADQAERLQKEMRQVFSLGNQGGVWVVQDAINYQAISTPPKDAIALSLYDTVKTRICNAYHIPRVLLDQQDTTPQGADTAKRSFEEDCLVPLLSNILDTMTHHLCPKRLFFVADDIVTPDRQLELQERAQVMNELQGNVATVNEARTRLGYEPAQGMDKFLYQLLGGGSMGTLPTIGVSRSAEDVKKKSATDDRPDPDALADVLRTFFGRLRDHVMGMTKSATGISTKAFIDVGDWASDLMKDLVPVLRIALEEGGAGILGKLGGETLPVLPVLELDRAAATLAKRLADSTLATTSLALDEAHQAVRDAVAAGLAAGEANAQLTDRLQAIFTNLTEERAYLIAETESAAAKHAGELITIREADIDAKKVWLCDDMACVKCRPLNGKVVGLDEPFTVLPGGGPYAVVQHPPLHPACRCTLTYEFPGQGD